MNKDLYIELLEKKVSDLETALVTVSDKLIETEQVKKKVQSDYDELIEKHHNMKGHYDESLELAQIIVDMVHDREVELYDSLQHAKRLEMDEDYVMNKRYEWYSVNDLKERIDEYYESKVG